MAFTHALLSLATAGALGAAPAGPALTCDYTFSAWPGGFSANLTIANTGLSVSGWTARWSVTTPTALGSVWSASMAQPDPAHLVATNVSWNATIPPGRSVTFGWTASAVTTSRPTDITVNGAPC